MDFLGKKIVHKSLGIGTVILHNDSKVRVQFSDKEIDFSYPQSFRGFLEFVEPADQTELLTMLQKDEAERIAADAKDPMLHLVAPQSIVSRASRAPGVSRTRTTSSNIAFKCNYCDGGKNRSHIGYLGACSDDVIYYNIYVAHHSWCSAENSSCMQYMNGEISRQELDQMCGGKDYICYESQMLRNWKAFAGYVLYGEKKNEPRKIRQVQVNSLAILTTREPDADESSRFIFGVFLIDGINRGSSSNEGSVWSDSEYRIELSPDEAHQIRFWNYHANNNNPQNPAWAQGLYRYLSDVEAAQILRDIVKVKKSHQEKQKAADFLEYYCKIHRINPASIPTANGALNR